MLFKEVIGQSSVKKRLITSILEGRIAHAQLFTGPEGCGKLALALAYAQFLSCTNRQGSDACGTCHSCIKYQKLIHPDLHFVYPVVKTVSVTKPISDTYLAQWREKIFQHPDFRLNDWYSFLGAENKQGMIYAHESNEIIKKLSLKTYESPYKVMIIWMPEKMNETCANKLLKMIEEPPEKTIFLLVSENPEQIITTILSRCQLIKIPPIKHQDLKQNLIEKYSLQEIEAEDITRIANGNIIKALELMESSEENSFNLKNFQKMMRMAYSAGKNLPKLKKWADSMGTMGREQQKSFLNYCQRLIRENFILNLQNPDLNYLSSNEMTFSQKFSPFINEANIMELYEEFAKAERHIEQNVLGKLVFFDLSLRIIMLLKHK